MKSPGRLLEDIKAHRRFWAVCGGLFLLNVLFYFFFVASESGETAALQSRFQTERKKVAEQRKRQAQIEHFTALQASWQDFERVLPDKVEFPERIQELKETLGRHGLKAEDLAFRAEPMADTGLVRFAATLKTAGSYDALKRLIGDIRALEGLFCIHGFELRRPEAGPVVMTMDLSAYFKTDNPQAAAP